MAALLKLSETYWTEPVETIIDQVQSSHQGLNQSEVVRRLTIYGPNAFIEEKRRHPIFLFLNQFTNPLILVLLFASIVSAIAGQVTECLIIFTIIFASAAIDFYQQHQASHAVARLRERVAIMANVIRNGKRASVLIADIVPGDIISLMPGTIIPADAKIMTAEDLHVDESSLTGESLTVAKTAQPQDPLDASLAERHTCVYLGTSVVSGTGTAVVVATGKQTEFGRIGQDLSQPDTKTAFEQGLDRFGFFIMCLTLILVLFVFIVNGFFKHSPILDTFLFSLALAVGLTPELLPIILTLNLSRGALRMAKKGVIVKSLPAIENFGSMDILCTDKTGTLTENHIRLERYEDVEGLENQAVLRLAHIASSFHGGVKDHIDEAILRHKLEHAQGLFTKLDELPFDFERKSSSILISDGKQNQLIIKGAPERLLAIASTYIKKTKSAPLSKTERDLLTQRFTDLSEQGFRVLALATKDLEKKSTYTVADEDNVTFVGLMAFLDPAKESAKEALEVLEKKHIAIKILTGDNELVTKKVCVDLNLPIDGILTGKQIDQLLDPELLIAARHTTIFARITPEQKHRIITILKQDGNVVGYLGDGINDALSLKAADVGISVNNAVDVAKDAADLILLHKDLHVLIEGVHEGRETYGNIMKYIMMSTSSNFGNMFSVAGASLFLPFLPMLPVQILLNNLLYDVSQLAIASDKVDPEYLRKPRKWDIRFIRKFMLTFGPISSLFDFITFIVLLRIFQASAGVFRTGWFIESLVSQALIILMIRTSRSPFYKSKPSDLLLFSTIFVVFFVLVLPYLPFAHYFAFQPVPGAFYGALLFLIIAYIIIVERAKQWFYSRIRT